MDKNDGNKFKELITAINLTYEEDFTESKTLLWWNLFKPYSAIAFERAVYQHISCPDSGQFSPKPANIMKFINGNTKQNEQQLEDKADIAWLTITGEVKRVGSWGSLKMEDKQALAAVKSLGGWKFICSKTEAELVWLHKEFIATYKNFERTDVNLLPNKLPGRVLLENAKKNGESLEGGGLKSISEGIASFRENNKDHK
tara:strand:- start:1456 stop:2055 length:600 start_codon:yes stop_codon:yes gene_type:complete